MVRQNSFKRTTLSIIAVLATCSALAGVSVAQKEQSKVVSYIEAFTIHQDESGEEVRAPAESVSPGGVIEYQMTYKNISEDMLGEFIIRGDVPPETYFLSSRDLPDVPAIFEVSVSDIGWATPPVIRYVEDEEGILRPAEVPDEEFEALRWRLVEPIAPGEEVSATYRIRVEN